MIQKLEVSAKGDLELTEELKKYIDKRIGKLDKYIPRHARESAHAEVKLKGEESKNSNQFTAEVVLFLPNEQITAKEATINIYAAIDIVEQKVRNQLRSYKEKVTNHKQDRKGILRKFRRLADSEADSAS